jgi:hypothetical protein
MANRLFNQFSFGLEKMRVSLFMRMTIGLTGAPTLIADESKGIESVSRIGVGLYRITLQDAYVKLLMMSELRKLSSNATQMLISVENVNNKIIEVAFVNTAGAQVELGNGEEVRMSIVLRNSTAP